MNRHSNFEIKHGINNCSKKTILDSLHSSSGFQYIDYINSEGNVLEKVYLILFKL